MPTEIVASGRCVLTVKLAVLVPAGMVTLAGTVAKVVLLLVSITTAPPAGAGALRATVPVARSRPRTLVGLRVSAASAGPAPGVAVGAGVAVGSGVGVGGGAPVGNRVRVAVRVTPAPLTEIVTVVVVVTGLVLIRKPPATAHCGTWTLGGTLASAGLLLDRMR